MYNTMHSLTPAGVRVDTATLSRPTPWSNWSESFTSCVRDRFGSDLLSPVCVRGRLRLRQPRQYCVIMFPGNFLPISRAIERRV
jgi:hypothetical protein